MTDDRELLVSRIMLDFVVVKHDKMAELESNILSLDRPSIMCIQSSDEKRYL